ncbi:MAG: class A beta-lactamase-related serine hydrolase [Ignavibacteriales bacterium]|nr:class A beta-lactamase-related serine hydrolase [Ignavibacteriales bacterium]
MKQFIIFVSIAACTVTLSGMDHKHMTLKKAGETIDSIAAATPGIFGIAFADLQTGRTLMRNAAAEFHAASTMKTAVMVEVFRQARTRKLSLNDSLSVVNSFKSIVDESAYSLDVSSDSDDSLYHSIGKKCSVRKLLHAMITVSSNLATNILIEKIGAKNVAATMRALGVPGVHVLRGVEDGKAFDAGMNNTTTARDMMRLFVLIAREQAVSKTASKAMTDILLDQRFNDCIPAFLPSAVKVAHKTGSITGIQHDAGFVMLPGGRKYVLVVLIKELKDPVAGRKAIASISKVLYDYEVQ